VSNMETKQFGGRVVEHKEIERDGVRLGIIECLIATWEEDTGGVFGIPDRFERGAFAGSIEEHKRRNNRMVRLKDQHGGVVGGFPIDTVEERADGLFAVGEINLETKRGAEIWALIRQGVLVDMSVGFRALKDRIESGVRIISKAILWEGSVVDEPANRGANILNLKSVAFADLPVAPLGYEWDPVAAAQRVGNLADLERIELKDAFLQEVNADDEAFALPIADVIEGKLTVVPEALTKAAEGLRGVEGADELREHLERYFAKLGVASPFDEDERKFFGAAEVREWKSADIERALLSGVKFSKGAARVLASRLSVKAAEITPDANEAKRVLQGLVESLREAKRELVGNG